MTKESKSGAGMITPLILSGGFGTRLWPLSRVGCPKQFLPLCSDRPLVVGTAERMKGEGYAKPVFVAQEMHRFLLSGLLEEAGLEYEDFLIEPESKNTAAAVCAGALHVRAAHGSAALMLVVPSDHLVRDEEAFHETIRRAVPAAEAGKLVCIGIPPTRAETGYGYIGEGETFENSPHIRHIRAFTEKPDAETAQCYLEEGGYYWNSGLYLAKADIFLAEMRAYAADLATQTAMAYDRAVRDLHFLRLDKVKYAKIRAESFDRAVSERTRNAVFIAGDFGWTDIGSYTKLWQETPRDENGNAVMGPATLKDCADNYIYSTGPRIVAIGVRDTAVVADGDSVLVLPKALDQATDELAEEQEGQSSAQQIIHRPWGWYKVITAGPGFQTKQIEVKPGHRLSLQRHRHRAEHWVCVKGRALVHRGGEEMALEENQSVYIPMGTPHRLTNPGPEPLQVIEVQTGLSFDESDIERLEDDYARPAAPARAPRKAAAL